jgi:hypothetical protein
MSLEHSPSRQRRKRQTGKGSSSKKPPDEEPSEFDYWNSLINEESAAKFVNLTQRCLQGFRYRGGGPAFIRLSCRCIRYRRTDLRAWADARVRTSTSDQGPEAG